MILRKRIGPLEPALLAEDVQALQVLVDLDLLPDLALFFRDPGEPLAVLAAAGLRGGELALRAPERVARHADEQQAADGESRHDQERQRELLDLLAVEAHRMSFRFAALTAACAKA